MNWAQSFPAKLKENYKQSYQECLFWNLNNENEVQEEQGGHPVKSQYVYGTTGNGEACSPSAQYIHSIPERQIKLFLLLSRKAKEVTDQP